MDIWVYKKSKELGDPNAVHLWVEGVIIPFYRKMIEGEAKIIAAPVGCRYKEGAKVRDPHNYFVPTAAYLAAIRTARDYFRRHPIPAAA